MELQGKWTGYFASDTYTLLWLISTVKGDIELNVSSSSPDADDITKTEAHIQYTGLYRAHQEETVEFNHSSDKDQGIRILSGCLKQRREQKMSFIIEHLIDDYIYGTYYSVEPYDKGRFYLKRENTI